MSSELRILLVDDKLEERASLRRLLASTDLPVAAIEECGAGGEAQTLLQEIAPDVVLVSFEEPIARSLKTIENLARSESGVVMAVSSLGDREYLRRAMRAGAQEYLVKPLKPKELARAIQDILQEQRRKALLAESGTARADVLMIMGPKGGIGKTTLATNLAVALAQETQQRVAVVDLAKQLGDVAMMLDIVPERTIADLAGLGRSLEPEMLDGFMSSHSSGVRVLAAPAEIGTNGFLPAPTVRQIVDALARSCDYVVIDGDHLLTEALWAALELATVILLVTSPDTSSVKNTRLFMEVLRTRGYRDDRVKLVVNYPYQESGISPGDLGKVVNYPIFWKIPHDPVCGQCVNMGQSFVQARPKAKVSQNIRQLARTMSGVHAEGNGFLGRIIHR